MTFKGHVSYFRPIDSPNIEICYVSRVNLLLNYFRTIRR